MPAARVALLAIWMLCACSKPREAESPLHGKWTSPLGRSHPLAGLVWDDAQRKFVIEDTVLEAVAGATFVGIGEQHDNADHHAIQARLIEWLASRGRRPGVVFEMLDRDDEVTIQQSLQTHPHDPDAVAAAADWAHSGWPSWSMYRPVFAAAVSKELPLLAGGIDRKAAMKLATEGPAAASPDLVRDYGLDRPLDGPVQESLRGEMRDAHCGLLPDSMLDGMVFVQRVRDATLADGLARSGASRGGVLIAGNGHVRRDRGVPDLIRKKNAGTFVAVGLVEVREGWTDAADYAAPFGAAELPFDYVVFTPRANDVDHCAEMRAKRAGP